MSVTLELGQGATTGFPHVDALLLIQKPTRPMNIHRSAVGDTEARDFCHRLPSIDHPWTSAMSFNIPGYVSSEDRLTGVPNLPHFRYTAGWIWDMVDFAQIMTTGSNFASASCIGSVYLTRF